MECRRIDLGGGNFAVVCSARRSKRVLEFPAAPKDQGMKLPATQEQLIAGGCRLVKIRKCKLCGIRLEFWRTLSDQLMPLEFTLRDGKTIYLSHWETCRREKPKKKPDPKSGNLFR